MRLSIEKAVFRSRFDPGTFVALRRRLAHRLSAATFVASVMVIAFMIGFLFGVNKWFPYFTVQKSSKTIAAIIAQYSTNFGPFQFIDFSGGPPADVEKNRFIVRAAVPDVAANEHFLMSGGLDQYLDYCPRNGCIAVEFTRTGSLVHAYPYRPDQFEAHQIVSLPYEQVGFSFAENMYPVGLVKLQGGDLIVTFHQFNTFPFAGGIARIRPDGSVVWFRHDYSHHWPRLLPDGNIAVPAMRIGPAQISVPLAQHSGIKLDCDGKIEEDIVRIINPDGQVQQEIPVLSAFLHSPYRSMLMEAPVPCDPLHLNYVTSVTRGIVSLYHDVAPDDLIVSLRNLDAFAILGRHDHRIKHVFNGTFVRQHSVQPLGQSATMLIFDDLGGNWKAAPSRFLSYDLADGAERTVLANPDADGHPRYSSYAGDISVSPDLSRAIVSFARAGRAYEVRLSDGKVLTVFNNIDDLRRVPAAGKGREHAAGRFTLYTAEYVH